MQRFFKTGKGEYGEGDQFIGVSVPEQRKIAKKYQDDCTREDLIMLLDSPVHEERLTGVFILVYKFKKSIKLKTEMDWLSLYIEKADRMNNWDLVDSSAHHILGRWMAYNDHNIQHEFAVADSLWKNRIAVVSCLYFIKKGVLKELFPIATIMLKHPHDLIHKATGWMLREAWQKQPEAVEAFLVEHKNYMPRTMLRYSIEKMPENKRREMMAK